MLGRRERRKKRDGEQLSERGSRRERRRKTWWDGESGLTEYVFELSGECPSFRERGWVHGL